MLKFQGLRACVRACVCVSFGGCVGQICLIFCFVIIRCWGPSRLRAPPRYYLQCMADVNTCMKAYT